jgi:ectoine hydroxylase-related dioxygenase (phytanoyl-CoA dioxygenase family)
MDEKGFVKLERVIEPSVRDSILSEIDKLQSIISQEDCFIEERNSKPKQLQNLHKYSESFFVEQIYRNHLLPRLKDTLLIDREPFLIKNVQFFQKWPGESGVTRMHQDDWYFQLPETQYALTCWLALDDVNSESEGCLQYCPGSHKLGLLHHEPNTDGKWRIRSGVSGYAGYVSCDKDLRGLVPAPVKAGDMLVHTGRVLHCAGANNGTGMRRALTFILFFSTSFSKPCNLDH